MVRLNHTKDIKKSHRKTYYLILILDAHIIYMSICIYTYVDNDDDDKVKPLG